MRTPALIATLCLILLSGCADASEGGYEEDAEITDLRSELEAANEKLEAARLGLDDAQSQLADLQMNLSELENEQGNFAFTDWREVVPAIGSGIGAVSASAAELESGLSDIESSLAE